MRNDFADNFCEHEDEHALKKNMKNMNIFALKNWNMDKRERETPRISKKFSLRGLSPRLVAICYICHICRCKDGKMESE